MNKKKMWTMLIAGGINGILGAGINIWPDIQTILVSAIALVTLITNYLNGVDNDV